MYPQYPQQTSPYQQYPQYPTTYPASTQTQLMQQRLDALSQSQGITPTYPALQNQPMTSVDAKVVANMSVILSDNVIGTGRHLYIIPDKENSNIIYSREFDPTTGASPVLAYVLVNQNELETEAEPKQTELTNEDHELIKKLTERVQTLEDLILEGVVKNEHDATNGSNASGKKSNGWASSTDDAKRDE